MFLDRGAEQLTNGSSTKLADFLDDDLIFLASLLYNLRHMHSGRSLKLVSEMADFMVCFDQFHNPLLPWKKAQNLNEITDAADEKIN